MLAAVETSARDAWSVEEAFIMMARQLLLQNGMSVKQDDSEAAARVLLRTNSHTVSLSSPSSTHDSKKPCEC